MTNNPDKREISHCRKNNVLRINWSIILCEAETRFVKMPVSIAGTESDSKERDHEITHECAEDRKWQELKSSWNHFRINVIPFRAS